MHSLQYIFVELVLVPAFPFFLLSGIMKDELVPKRMVGIAVNEKPVIVQRDGSILLEVGGPYYEEARDALARFAELVKSPEYVHTYRLSPLSLWNAAATGMSAREIEESLSAYSRYPVPDNILRDIRDYLSRYGKLKLIRQDETLLLVSDDPLLITEIANSKGLSRYIEGWGGPNRLKVAPAQRGYLKQALIKLGWPVEDLAGYTPGAPLAIDLRSTTLSGKSFALRSYQEEAVAAFWASGSERGGSGVVVLPCGAGKTMVGLGAMARARCHTLIIVTSTTAVHQWRDEILDKTTLGPDEVGEYTGDLKDVRPVTIATYQVLTWRPSKTENFPHFAVFNARDWGLIIYDEVHLLPAPVFRVTADLQARRRLGLTATLVREDGREEDVFTLVGPKRYDVPWKVLEKQGWIATATCTEIRLSLPQEKRLEYALARDPHVKYRLAAENPAKLAVVRELVARHRDDQVLVIGQYLDQLAELAAELKAPLITGRTPTQKREALFAAFREGREKVLVVSRVANFSIDLPEANVAIQVSGTFGSRQEEAQRLGRILRPKAGANQAYFYTLVTRDTKDQEYAAKRQLFLTEQGYRYTILDAAELTDRLGSSEA
ncbi:MAG: excision repair protein [Bacillota bacterium]|nr:excision repair protein [Bacillota bacterium]MDK2883143.1 excision repair protein [Bacillota bacterium]MDK2925940.1 excision repair protein [Bacillota bacterium]